MEKKSILYERSIKINDYITVEIPTVQDVLDNEDEYYGIVSSLVATPYDMMVQLDDIDIDFTEIDDYELFLIVFQGLRDQDTSLIFGDLDLSGFELAVNEQNEQIVLLNCETGAVIDRAIHFEIAEALRKIHHLKRNNRKAANESAKKFLIERARKKMKREQRKGFSSQLEPLIIAMVNTEQFKYDFETTKTLTIHQFNESVIQIVHKVNYLNIMHGIYAGTVSVKDVDQNALNWISNEL